MNEKQAVHAIEPELSVELIEQLQAIMNFRPAYSMQQFAEHCRSFTSRVEAESPVLSA